MACIARGLAFTQKRVLLVECAHLACRICPLPETGELAEPLQHIRVWSGIEMQPSANWSVDPRETRLAVRQSVQSAEGSVIESAEAAWKLKDGSLHLQLRPKQFDN